MASIKSKPLSIEDFDLTMSKSFEHKPDNSGLTHKSRILPHLDAANIRHGILLAEVLGPPLAKRKGYRKWL